MERKPGRMERNRRKKKRENKERKENRERERKDKLPAESGRKEPWADHVFFAGEMGEREPAGEEERLLQYAMGRFSPFYWSGIKLLEGGLYGAFRFQKGAAGREHAVGAAFLLNEREFAMVVQETEDSREKCFAGEEKTCRPKGTGTQETPLEKKVCHTKTKGSGKAAGTGKNRDPKQDGEVSGTGEIRDPKQSGKAAGEEKTCRPKGEERSEASAEENFSGSGTTKSGNRAPWEDGLEALFDKILTSGQEKIESMEEYMIQIEQEIVGGRFSQGRDQNRAIFECKRLLTVWKNDYNRFLDMIEGINGLEQKKKEGQEPLLNEDTACYFHVYENKLRRLTEEAQFLYEELVHVREALDAALSYEQNRIMKVFTTVTTVFMPLTLVTGWYGMNFAFMPELHWRYGYLFACVLSGLVVLACIWFFRKKKLF